MKEVIFSYLLSRLLYEDYLTHSEEEQEENTVCHAANDIIIKGVRVITKSSRHICLRVTMRILCVLARIPNLLSQLSQGSLLLAHVR